MPPRPAVSPPPAPGASPGPAVCVVLVRPQGPVNVGLVARACANAGDVQLRLVAPRCDARGPEARRFAAHAGALLDAAPQDCSLAAAVADATVVIGSSGRRRCASHRLLRPEGIAGAAGGAARGAGGGRLALVFGNEADGLSAAELDACALVLRLPGAAAQPSYSLSHAVAICLYALRWAAPAPPPAAAVPPVSPLSSTPAADAADAASRAHLRDLLLAVAARHGYLGRVDGRRWAPKLGRLVAAARLGRDDVRLLCGLLAHLLPRP